MTKNLPTAQKNQNIGGGRGLDQGHVTGLDTKNAREGRGPVIEDQERGDQGQEIAALDHVIDKGEIEEIGQSLIKSHKWVKFTLVK